MNLYEKLNRLDDTTCSFVFQEGLRRTKPSDQLLTVLKHLNLTLNQLVKKEQDEEFSNADTYTLVGTSNNIQAQENKLRNMNATLLSEEGDTSKYIRDYEVDDNGTYICVKVNEQGRSYLVIVDRKTMIEKLCDDSIYDDDIDEMLTENRNNPYFTPYGYRDAAKVLSGKAPDYYYNLKEIEMDEGDGIKLAKYALRKGLPVMVDPDDDPDYPTFFIEGKYHWNDYFYPYSSAHEDNLVAWDGKMFIEQLTEETNGVSSQLPEDVDAFLQDLAQMYGMIDYKDILKHEYTDEEIKKLRNYERRFNAEIEYEGDEEADAIMNDIAEKVTRLVKH